MFDHSWCLIKCPTCSSSGHYSSHEDESYSGSLAPRYHPVTSPSPSQYDQLAVSTRDVRDNRLSPTYDSRSRNISGEGQHYRETVEKSLQTSHNLMSVVTGSITPSQPKTRPTSQASKQGSKKNQPSKEVSGGWQNENPSNNACLPCPSRLRSENRLSWIRAALQAQWWTS